MIQALYQQQMRNASHQGASVCDMGFPAGLDAQVVNQLSEIEITQEIFKHHHEGVE
jgi:hypothetical protein